MKIVISSCDYYKPCWPIFITLLQKYWPDNCNDYYFIAETPDDTFPVLSFNSDCWSVRTSNALRQLNDDYIIFMLDDMFIRQSVDDSRIKAFIEYLPYLEPLAVINFELKYYQSKKSQTELLKYLNLSYSNAGIYVYSSQPSLWKRNVLISTLQKPLNIWQWEMQNVQKIVNNCYINSGDYIIDIGYRHQPLETGWGITRGKLTNECRQFLKDEGIDFSELENRFGENKI